MAIELTIAELSDAGMEPLTPDQDAERQVEAKQYVKDYLAEIKRTGIYLKSFIAPRFCYSAPPSVYKDALKEIKGRRYQVSGSQRTWIEVIESLMEAHSSQAEHQEDVDALREEMKAMRLKQEAIVKSNEMLQEALTLALRLLNAQGIKSP